MSSSYSVGSLGSFHDLGDEINYPSSNVFTASGEFEKGTSCYEVTVYDVREGGFAKGTIHTHTCRDIDGLKRSIVTTFKTCDKFLKLDDLESPNTCIITSHDQLQETQVLLGSPLACEEDFSGVSGEVTRCISIHPDTDIRDIIDKYNCKTDAGMEFIFFPKLSSVLKSGMFKEFNVRTFEKGRLMQDSDVDLQVNNFVDAKREIVLHMKCRKTDCISLIKEQLVREFEPEFASAIASEQYIWLRWKDNVFGDQDFPFLDSRVDTDNEDNQYRLTVHLCTKDILIVPFEFECHRYVIVLPSSATVEDLRHAASKVLHKGAECLMVTIQKKKCSDKEQVSAIFGGSKRNLLRIEAAKEKKYTWRVFNSGLSTIDVMAFKQDTIGTVKDKIAARLQVDPFFLQLLLNASKMDNSGTLYSHRVRTNDVLEVVIFRHRIRLSVKMCKGKKIALTVDEIDKTTVNDLIVFCAHIWSMVPANISLMFNGRILENFCTLQHHEVASGHVLVAVCNDGDDDFVAVFTAASCGRITKQKYLKTRGNLVPVDEDFTFESSPDVQSILTRHTVHKGIALGTSQCPCHTKHVPVSTRRNFQLLLTKNKVESGGDIYNQEASPVSVAPITPRDDHDSLGGTVAPRTGDAVDTTTPRKETFYVGDDQISPEMVISETETRRVVRSGDGSIKEMSRTFNTHIGPLNTDLISPLSSNALAIPRSLSMGHLPEPRNAVHDSVLSSVAEKLGNDWQRLCLKLGVDFCKLEAIKQAHQNDLTSQALRMLHYWKRQFGSKATVDCLCKALRDCELAIIAESVENIHTEEAGESPGSCSMNGS